MLNDFVEYWAAAKLFLAGGNPYSPTELLKVERSIGWLHADPLLMWNPPWTLPLILPLGLLDYDTAQFAWFLLHSVIIFVGAQILWQIYAGDPKKRHHKLVSVLAFVPVYFALLLGQIGPVILAGLVAFLFFVERKAWFLAGASLSLASVKPHLLYLFWIALVFWTLHEYCWRLALGAVVATLAMAVMPLWWHPATYVQYAQLLSSREVVNPIEWATPTLGTALGLLFGNPNGPMRWLPSIIGTVWFVWYWSRRRRNWNWIGEMPLILLVSVATASFAWTFDYVVLLPAVVQCAVWIGRNTARRQPYTVIGIYVCLSAALVLGKAIAINDFWYFWYAPMLLLLYIHLQKRQLSTTQMSL